MMNRTIKAVLVSAVLFVLTGVAVAVPPVVKTVPWVASNPLIPHDTYLGKVIALKGTSDQQGSNIEYTWDFGDGTPVATGRVMDLPALATDRRSWAVYATHAYTGSVGTLYTARLTVRNSTTGETANKTYFVQMRDKALPVEVNIAIDEGLWHLHKAQIRSTVSGAVVGDWMSCPSSGIVPMSCASNQGYTSNTAANVHAFLVNGHSEDGDPNNPYTDTAARGMRRLFQMLSSAVIGSSQTNPKGTFNPDTNRNGYGVYVSQGTELYQGGMFMDAIIAANTPNKVTTTGQAPSGANPGILGRTYRAIVQDMADYYSYCQYDGSSGALALGGWRYSCNEFPDNSAVQWAAIGLLPAQRNLGIPVPAAVRLANLDWTTYSQNSANGVFGYTNTSPAWGPFATTPSGMVQLAWTGIGRGNPKWDKAETYMRDNFHLETGSPLTSPRDYYYGLFSFVKSLLLHDSNGDGIAEPITTLQSSSAGVSPIDWYSAERNMGLPLSANNTNGIARTLVNDQSADGYWSGHNYYGTQFEFETAWAIIMLNRTIFAAGAPVAVAEATPNPGVVGQTITLNGAASFHQDTSKSIDSWEWDFGNNGSIDATGPTATTSYPALGDYPVRLRVSDNASPEQFAETVITVRITVPPLPPTAEAGGPYNFCTNRTPWFLDAKGSSNPDEGQSEPGQTPNTIISYTWDLNGDGTFGDVTGATPNVTGLFGLGSTLIQLRVTDNTAASFPSSGLGNLSDTDTAQVVVRTGTDPACVCVSNLAARPKLNKAELTWTPRAGVHHYNIYRGTVDGGPYVKIGEVPGTSGFYLDNGPLTLNVTYYWIVREAQLNNTENCQSNQAMARMTGRL